MNIKELAGRNPLLYSIADKHMYVYRHAINPSQFNLFKQIKV